MVDKSIEMLIRKRDLVFRNAMTFEVLLELIGIFCDQMVLAEVAVVALGTTIALWHVFLSGDKKLQRGARCEKSR